MLESRALYDDVVVGPILISQALTRTPLARKISNVRPIISDRPARVRPER